MRSTKSIFGRQLEPCPVKDFQKPSKSEEEFISFKSYRLSTFVAVNKP